MSEKIRLSPENAEVPNTPEQNQEVSKNLPEKKTKDVEHEHKRNIEHIKHKIEASAKDSHELRHMTDTEKTPRTNGKFAPGKQLRKNNLSHSLKKIRRELPSYQRPFSKLIHNDVVEAVSEASEKTVARPSGLLVGGITSFLTSLAVLFICRYYGYEYNYLIGLVSFGGGFVIGVLGEFIIKSLRRG